MRGLTYYYNTPWVGGDMCAPLYLSIISQLVVKRFQEHQSWQEKGNQVQGLQTDTLTRAELLAANKSPWHCLSGKWAHVFSRLTRKWCGQRSDLTCTSLVMYICISGVGTQFLQDKPKVCLAVTQLSWHHNRVSLQIKDSKLWCWTVISHAAGVSLPSLLTMARWSSDLALVNQHSR